MAKARRYREEQSSCGQRVADALSEIVLIAALAFVVQSVHTHTHLHTYIANNVCLCVIQ